jgi:hypothetical protein
MNSRQHWFVIILLGVLSTIGALGLVLQEPTEAAYWVFATPLSLLCLWGFARVMERTL